MPSIIPGYENDIFISYRQKDNKGDRWVTQFVEALKTELESTFKEEVSVYFDINPHDGLLETHDVDASLKEKLKCLIFIPIISRTYCDPKSFAWEHEFKAFVEMASKDGYGLKVKLANGNVTSRVLPVQIHDLDSDDKNCIETVLGGHIRAVEFIYREPGVERPLKPEDKEGSFKYNNQVNKVAHAIRGIVNGLKSSDAKPEISTDDKPTKKATGRKSALPFILGFVLLLIIGGVWFSILQKTIPLERSIAVLPFINESPVDSNKYFINGIMEEVLSNLQHIAGFRVLSRTSTDRYRGPDKPAMSKIAKELGVNYVVEGSGQKYGNMFHLRVQLIKAFGEEDHLWAKSFELKLEKTSDIFEMQRQISNAIASELKTVITPYERIIIDKSATSDLSAYNLYLKAQHFLNEYSRIRDPEAYNKALTFYKAAIGIDSSFAEAYTGLAWTYVNKYYWETYFKENFLDTCRVLADMALKFDDNSDDAFYLKGFYYQENGLTKEALENYDKAIKINPNYYEAYNRRAYVLKEILKDYVSGIDNYQRALKLMSKTERARLIRDLGWIYSEIGFSEQAKQYYVEAFSLDSNRFLNFKHTAQDEFNQGNFEVALHLFEMASKIDTSYSFPLMFYDVTLNHKEEAFQHAIKAIQSYKKSGAINLGEAHRIGYAYWQLKKYKEAKYYFQQQIKYSKEILKYKRKTVELTNAQYDLAATYAFLNEKDKAYEYLDEFNKWNFYDLTMMLLIKHDPLFANIRNEERFQKIVRQCESKYQAEHERVRKWLEENKML